MTSAGSTCPLPLADYPQITLAHGGGGRLMKQLIEQMFYTALGNEWLGQAHDGATLPRLDGRPAITTDSFVVSPLFFPGGDIGKLAVFGTVNDLAMCGAQPKYLTLSLIIEEGFATEQLWRVIESIRDAATQAGVDIVTGDTKVVERGKGDGLYINTAGVGIVTTEFTICPDSARPGDAILLSGDLGRHGIAVMAQREGLSFEGALDSDCACLWPAVQNLLETGIPVHMLRDLTRGGLTAALNEIADTAQLRVEIDEDAIPVSDEVRGACELLGLDPYYVANEGRFIAIVSQDNATAALAALRQDALCANACLIGRVEAAGTARVVVRTRLGSTRILDLLSGEQLPRIC